MDYAKAFEPEYLEHIKYFCIIFSEDYIKKHFDDIKKYASVIEDRSDDSWCTLESTLEDNAKLLSLARKQGAEYILIEDKYEINIEI